MLAKQQEFLGLDHLLRKALALPSAVLNATLGEAASTKRKQDKEQEGGSQLPAGKHPVHEPFLQRYVLEITKYFGSTDFPAKHLLLMSQSGRKSVTAVSSPRIHRLRQEAIQLLLFKKIRVQEPPYYNSSVGPTATTGPILQSHQSALSEEQLPLIQTRLEMNV